MPYLLHETVYLYSKDQCVWPVNKAGESINICTEIRISSVTNKIETSFKVELGLNHDNVLFSADTYAKCYGFIKKYIKDLPVLKKLIEWNSIHAFSYVCEEVYYNKLEQELKHAWLTEEDYLKIKKNLTFTKASTFYKNIKNKC